MPPARSSSVYFLEYSVLPLDLPDPGYDELVMLHIPRQGFGYNETLVDMSR